MVGYFKPGLKLEIVYYFADGMRFRKATGPQ